MLGLQGKTRLARHGYADLDENEQAGSVHPGWPLPDRARRSPPDRPAQADGRTDHIGGSRCTPGLPWRTVSDHSVRRLLCCSSPGQRVRVRMVQMRLSASLAVIGAFWAVLRILAQSIQSSVCETSRGRAASFGKNGPARPESNTQRGLVEERMQRLAVSSPMQSVCWLAAAVMARRSSSTRDAAEAWSESSQFLLSARSASRERPKDTRGRTGGLRNDICADRLLDSGSV